jgi:hypothetical protein
LSLFPSKFEEKQNIQVIPKAVSNISQAGIGSQISGTVESIKDRMPVGRRDTTPDNVFCASIDCMPTTRLPE